MSKPTKRRSMGTIKVDSVAIRSGVIGGIENREPQIPNIPGLRQQASMSRLPRPKTKSSLGTGNRPSSIENGRQPMKQRASSSNIQPQNRISSAFRTPRSTSRGWTPKSGNSSRRQPLNNLHNPMPPRYSLAGGQSAVKTHLGIGIGRQSDVGLQSAIGKKKDLMNDKNARMLKQQELEEFCMEHNYERCGALKFGPGGLNSTEFKQLFLWLVAFLDCERFPEIENRTFPEKVPVILKEIGYRAHVSKQTFQTLGTSHSWPTVLATLDFLLDRAKLFVSIDTKWQQIIFPNQDNDGFCNDDIESEEIIRFDYFAETYNAFNRNQDDYNPSLNVMENRFWKREGEDVREIKKAERAFKGIKETLTEERSSYAEIENKLDVSKKTFKEKQSDLNKMKDYCDKMERQKESRVKDIQLLKHSVDTIGEKDALLQEELAQLRNICITQKNIDPDHVSPQIQYTIELLEKQVYDTKATLKSTENSIFQGEMEISKVLKEVQDICRSFNENLIELGLYSEFPGQGEQLHNSSFKLDAQQVSVHDVKEFLRMVERRVQQDERGLHEESKRVEKELHITNKEMGTRKIELHQIKEELERKLYDKDVLVSKINSEESKFKEYLSNLKKNISAEKSKDRKNLNKLETELKQLEDEEKALLKQRQKHRADGHSLLSEAPKRLLEKRKKQIEYLNKKIEEYKNLVEEKIQIIDNENDEMKTYVANLPRIKRDA